MHDPRPWMLVSIVFLVATARSQDWAQVLPGGGPTARSSHGMESIGGGYVLFGGNNAGTYAGDTWLFDGTNWLQLMPSPSPSARRRVGMAWDPVRGRLVMFGGQDQTGAVVADTWEFDGANWVQMTPANAPSARRDHIMVYDVNSGRVLLFGGWDGMNPPLNDTWEWDGANWTQRVTPTLPPGRWDHQMAYDASQGIVVMFGGTGAGGTSAAFNLGDTWIWNGVDWVQATPTVSPSNRRTHCMTYDPRRGRIALFAGWDGAYRDDVWEFIGTTWEARTISGTTPGGRGGSRISYDPILDRVFVFGGFTPGGAVADTWELGANLVWQTNQAAATLQVDGLSNTAFSGPIAVTKLLGETGTVSLQSGLTGNLFDVALNVAPAVSAVNGGFIAPGGQIVNVTVLPVWAFGTFGGPWTLPAGTPLSLPYTVSSSFVVSGQMVVLDPGQPIGLSLSAAGQIEGLACVLVEDMESVPLVAGSYPAGWSNGGGTAEWIPNQGTTPSTGTGPTGDHTTGSGIYMFCETSAPNSTATFIADTGNQSTAGLTTPHADFWYHLDGATSGSLSLEEFDGVSWNQIWSVAGAQGAAWLNAHVPVTASGGSVQLRFVYMAGGFTGDAAIDDFALCN